MSTLFLNFFNFMIILVFHSDSILLERYQLEPFEQMPYTSHNALTVSEFCSGSRSSLLWTTREAMAFWMFSFNRDPSLRIGHAFRRIGEGGHTVFSSHYTGEGFDLSCGIHLSPHIPAPYPELQCGDIGVHVLVLQDALLTLGFDCMALDGYWGIHTEHALDAFSTAYSLPYRHVADETIWRQLLFRSCGAGIKKYTKTQNKD